ncbi:hypothetical protein JT359_03905 [Candidatus Poribacteria bacterium]|nr:hypothetical protein [Candidatus Poribacteria bacterium]
MLNRIRIISLSCIMLLLLGITINISSAVFKKQNLYLLELTDDSESKISLTAHSDFGDLINESPQYIPLAALLSLNPARVSQEYRNKDFHTFIPTEIVDKKEKTREVRVGEVWEIDADRLLPFLRQLHPGATVSLSGERGAYAVLKSVTEKQLEILFRFHADFNLSTMSEIEMDKVEHFSDKIASIKADADQDDISHIEAEVVRRKTSTLHVPLQSGKEELEEKEKEIRSLKVELESADEIPDKQKTFKLNDLTKELDTRFTALEQKLDKQLTKFRDSLSTTLQKQLTEQFDTIEKELAKNLTTVLIKELNNQITTLEAELAENLTALLKKELDTKLSEWKQTSDKQLQELTTTITKQEHRLNELSTQLTRLNAIYLTPNKFIGRLVINRKTKTVETFSITIPIDDTNGTISYISSGNIVDINIPLMKLTFQNDEIAGYETIFESQDNLEAITYQNAESILHQASKGMLQPEIYGNSVR